MVSEDCPEVLKAADYKAIQQELPLLYQLRDVAGLPAVMLEAVSRLIPNTFCTYNQINHRTGAVAVAYHPESWRSAMEGIMPLMVPHLEGHPVYRNVYDNGDGSPHFVSDFLSEEEWDRTPFASALDTIGVRESLIFCLYTSRQELIFIALNRPERSFTERDREVAESLRPHFAAAFENAVAFTEAKALGLLSAHAIDQSPYGVALADRDGQILHINAVAGELLTRYFPAASSWKAALPGELRRWLRVQHQPDARPPGIMTIEREDRALSVRSAEFADQRLILLFQESDRAKDAESLQTLGLSKRQAEVLHWTSEGKSNGEIGSILGISPRTVAKHLESIYQKIGVESRLAATLKAKNL